MISFRLNGKPQEVDVPGDTPVLWVLRDTVGLTGTKFGCGAALCGNCTVHLDGNAVRSCSTPMSAVAGKAVITIEGLHPTGDHPVQVALFPGHPVQRVDVGADRDEGHQRLTGVHQPLAHWRARLAPAIEARKAAHVAAASRIAARLLVEKPKAFRRRLEVMWGTAD